MNVEESRIKIINDIINKYPALSSSGLEATVGVAGGDDCAVIPINDKLDFIVGSDFIRGEGFGLYKRGLLSREEIGAYLVGANVSDLAAMGSSPVGIVVVYRYDKKTQDNEFSEIMHGVIKACQQFKIPLLGGDTGSYELPVLSAAAFGICPHGKALLRSNGKPGDILFLTGPTGIAGAAYQYFSKYESISKKLSGDKEDFLLAPWKNVNPAVEQGKALVEHELSACAIDTSDGLGVAARQLAEASNMDAIINHDDLNIPRALFEVSELLNCDASKLVLDVSVDFRLLFAVSPSLVEKTSFLFQEHGWMLIKIGCLRQSESMPGAYLKKGQNISRLNNEGLDY